MSTLNHLEAEIQVLQKILYEHPIYRTINTIDDLKQFMSIHVFAVWDFMNLLTTLQQEYTATKTPWQPPRHPEIARMINEIKLEEESDLIDSNITSHFEFYINCMDALGIDTTPIHSFLGALQNTTYEECLSLSCVPSAAKPFLETTYQLIQSGVIECAASFTFGRETIIPSMFLRLLSNVPDSPKIQPFKTYLTRHIELDGDNHGPLALRMVQEICENKEANWNRAIIAAKKSLEARIKLYSQIQAQLP